ncbi:hypothetical protein ACFE04_030621 [Oxalis oulophora]
MLKITILPFLFFFTNVCHSLNQDGLSLLALKAAVTTESTRSSLSSWSESDSTPCRWKGIECDDENRVNSLSLPNMSLTGYIPSELGLLDSLSELNLAHNNFSKLIPAHLFINSNTLLSIDLSHNSLTGFVPSQLGHLKKLTHLDLSSNQLNGSLPEFLIELKSLKGTLNLSYNRFSGEIPVSYGEFPVYVSLDLGHNNLSGRVPQVGSLLNQGPTAFAGNPLLCGFPLQNLCSDAQNSSIVGVNPKDPEDPNPNPLVADPKDGLKQNADRVSGSITVTVISGVSIIIGAVSVSVWLFRRKWGHSESVGGSEGKFGKKKTEETVVNVTEDVVEGQNGKFVVIDEGFSLELEDLLRASAYVIGKSKSGIVYKVVVGPGSSSGTSTAVAVRRLSECDAAWKFREFEAEVEAIGKVQHPNIVRLRAYYYAHDEKLLITDFVRNGSLYSALHGASASTSPLLSWASRLRIAQGVARGLMYVHEHSPRKYIHGNLKSTKILLDDELQPYISGFGLTRLFSGTSKFAPASKKLNSSNQAIVGPSNIYLAPEARTSGTKMTQKSDVYSFGIMLLELLTGRLPDAALENDGKGLDSLVRKVFQEERPLSEIIDSGLLKEVYAKKQVIAAFQIALNCTEIDPELRPRMKMVSESLDRVK